MPSACKLYKSKMKQCISLNRKGKRTKCKVMIERFEKCMNRQKKISNTTNPCK